jgi:CubicO group peptidase (beta-lactamase class C family)
LLINAFGATLVAGSVFYLTNQSLQADEREFDEEKIRILLDSEFLEDANEKVRDLVTIWKEESGSPGVVVGVSKNGTTVFSEGFGYADVENQLEMSPDTSLRVASISKALTSIALGLLLEQVFFVNCRFNFCRAKFNWMILFRSICLTSL